MQLDDAKSVISSKKAQSKAEAEKNANLNGPDMLELQSNFHFILLVTPISTVAT